MVGFEDGRITNYFDCFRGTSKEAIAKKFGVQGANVYARRAIKAVSR
jgi:hypothetical protein